MSAKGIFATTVLFFLVSVCAMADQTTPDPTAEMTADLLMQQADGVKKLGNLADAEALYDMAVQSYPDGAKPHMARAQIRYMRKNYRGAIEDLDVYLSRSPKDTRMLLLRSIAKSLLMPEDVAGACADMLRIKQLGTSLESLGTENTDKYCHGQPGWAGV
jgi:tetratricopeptide (TPR) repeat protein